MCKSTKFWRSASLIALGLTLLGCGNGEGAAPFDMSAVPSTTRLEVMVPRGIDAGDLGLHRKDVTVRVGDMVDDVFRALPVPKDGFATREDAPIVGDGISSRGWESPEESFGVISKDGRVVLAVDTYEKIDEERYAELRELYLTRYAAEIGGQISSERVNYWFASDGKQRLMLCTVLDARERRSLTVAIGVPEVMDALFMSPDDARQHAERSDALIKTAKPNG